MRKQLCALLMSLALLLSMFAGCGSTTSSSESAESSTEEASEQQAESTTSSADAASEQSVEGSVSETAESNVDSEQTSDATLPLVSETETITMWFPWSADTAKYVDDPNDTTFYKELEARTNVHIDFTLANSETATEQFQLLVSAGSYPDIIYGLTSRYNGGAEAAYEDEVVIDLMEYADLMPNLMSVLEDENISTYLITDNGYLIEPACVYEEMTLYTDGPLIRQDWLDELGLDTPVTYDDWNETLTAFKSAYDCDTAFFLPPEGAMVGNFLSSGYGVASISAFNVFTPFYIDNGTVKFGPSEEGYEQYITMLAQWYQEGLINSDFVSMSTSEDKYAKVLEGNCGIWIGDAPDISYYEEDSGYTIDIAPISDPTVTETQEGYMNKVGTYTKTDGYAVTTQAGNYELIAKWIDYQYSEEGSFLANWGIEGEGYTLDENGDPQLTELVTNNPNGITMITAMQIYVQYEGPFVANWRRNLADYKDEELAAMDIWNVTDAAGGLTQWPTSMEMNATEQKLYNEYWADIDTYFAEMSLKFITGAESLDNFDEFRQTLLDMGSENCVQAKQSAYDRYTS